MGIFYEEECYIIDLIYKEQNRNNRIIYYWLGNKRSEILQSRTAYMVVDMSK